MCAVVLAANGGCVYVAAPLRAAFQPFLALVLCGYSVGSRAEGRRALWVPPVLLAASAPMFARRGCTARIRRTRSPPYVWLIAAWAIGRTVRSWRTRTWRSKRPTASSAEQRELQAQAAVMVERGRIARELHDVIAHNVSMMVVQAGAAERVLDGDHPHVRNALDVIAATGRQTVDEMRTLLGVLRSDAGPAALTPQPSLADLGEAGPRGQGGGLPVTLRIDGEPCQLSQALGLSAFRIVQEALTNALKHAGPAARRSPSGTRPAGRALRSAIPATGQAAGTGTGTGLSGCGSGWRCLAGSSHRRPGPERRFPVRARMPFDHQDARVIRVLLADDQALVRGGFRLILEPSPTLRSSPRRGTGSRP